MAIFNGHIIVNSGRELLGRALAGEGKIIITRAAMGDGKANGDIRQLTKLVSEKITANVADIFNDRGTVNLKVQITNSELEEAFKTEEFGIYAKIEGDRDEVLYSYCTAVESDTIPSNSLGDIFVEEHTVYIAFSSDAEADIYIKEGVIFLTLETANKNYVQTGLVVEGRLSNGRSTLKENCQYQADDGKWYHNIGGNRSWTPRRGTPDDKLVEISYFNLYKQLDNKFEKGKVSPEYDTAEKIEKKLKELSGTGEISLDWSAIAGKPSTFPPASHNQASNTINYMTGYTKHNSGGAIIPADSLNIAMGKLEKNLDKKVERTELQGQYSTTDEINNLLKKKSDINHSHPILTIRNGVTVIQYDGTSAKEINITAGTEQGAHTHSTNEIIYLTGYNRSSYTGALTTSDPLNRALAKLENGIIDAKNNPNISWDQIISKPSTFNPAAHYQNSDSISYMTGYVKHSYGGAISPYDSLNVAIGKLEKNLDGKLSSADISGALNNKADKTHYHKSSDINSLSGYSKSSYIGAISPTDSLNRALAKLENGVEEAKNKSVSISWEQISGRPSSFTPNAHYQPSNTITSMEGYYIHNYGGAISPSDSLNIAIGKLEKNLANKASIDHAHSGYSREGHTHKKNEISDMPSTMPNPYGLYLKLNGVSQTTYNGSNTVTINITASSIGALSTAGGNVTGDITGTSNKVISGFGKVYNPVWG